jgi:hypothetical protein
MSMSHTALPLQTADNARRVNLTHPRVVDTALTQLGGTMSDSSLEKVGAKW